MRTLQLILTLSALLLTHEVLAQETIWKKPKLLRNYRMRVLMERDPEKSRASLEELLTHSEKNLKVFFSLQLGDRYERLGEYAKAESAFLQACNEARKFSPKGFRSYLFNLSGTVYDAFDKLGHFYLRTGNLRRAEQMFTESSEVRNRIFPEKSVHRIQPIIGMGSYYFRKGDHEKTYLFFNEAIRKMERATTTHYDYDHLNRIFLQDLTELCITSGRYEEASTYIDKLSIASSGLAKFDSRIGRKIQTALIFELKARYHLSQSNFEKANYYIERAEEFNSRYSFGEARLKILKTRAMLAWRQGDREKAGKEFKALVGAYRQHVGDNFLTMSEYERQQFYALLKIDFDLFNSFVYDVRTTRPVMLFEESYNHVINTKALLLSNYNKRKRQILFSGNQELIDKLRLWENAKAELSALYYRKDQEENIASLEKKIDSIEKEINRESPLFAEHEEEYSWQKIQEALTPEEAALEILRVQVQRRTESSQSRQVNDSIVYVGLLVRRSSGHPEYFVMGDGRELESRAINYYRNAIHTQIDDHLSYNKFWLPIARQLQGIKRIYISPDGCYNQINLNTLRNPASGKFLIDEMDVFTVTSTTDLLRARRGTAPTQVAALFGRPDYNNANTTQAAVTSTDGLRTIITDEMENFSAQAFRDLPGTEQEVTSIEQTLRDLSWTVHTYKGGNALEQHVKAIVNPTVLHIATHGFFVQDSSRQVNPMIRSGLLMAGVKAQNGNQNEDGILTAYEATNLYLDQTRLVVLSACETGVGEIKNGEGVYGLQRAIIVAGAENLLMSLWKVDDAATSELMTHMYESLSAENTREAFRIAQLKIREQYPHPFYWGAFVMLGK